VKTGRALTVVAEIAGREELDRVLQQLRGQLQASFVSRLPDTHFTRFVIIDDDRGELPALLVWESNHDGSTAAYLAKCAGAEPAGLDAVLGCCAAYPARGARDRDAFVGWAKRRNVRAEAFYCAYRGVSRAQVDNDRAVHDAIRDYLDAHRGELVELAPVEIQHRLAAHVRAQGLDARPQGDGEAMVLLRKLGYYAALVVVAAVALVLFPITVPMAYLGWKELRRREEDEQPPKATRPVHDDEGHRDLEDRIQQNQLTHVVDVKPGTFRLVTMRGFLFLVDVLSRGWCVYGDLAGITSIHFARWVLLKDPRGRRHRLVFFSNYDGSWDAYLGEFIDRAAWGLTGVWSNTDGFPATEGLIRKGALDEEAFKQWARDHQRPTQVWWSGVRGATVQNVRDDVWIRRRLAGPVGDPDLPGWLRKL